jgi:hypothetical protein
MPCWLSVSVIVGGVTAESVMPDMITAACLSTMSDIIAQTDSRGGYMAFDFDRTVSFATFGFLDGAVGHSRLCRLEPFIHATRIINAMMCIVAGAIVIPRCFMLDSDILMPCRLRRSTHICGVHGF